MNRDRLQRFADAVSAEIRAGQFTPERYRHYFPNGNLAGEFRPSTPDTAADQVPSGVPTLREYYEEWITRKKPPLVRAALERDYRLHLTGYILPATILDDRKQRRSLGSVLLTELKPTHLLQLQRELLARGLRLKTVRNIIDASFRAMIRDARTVDLLISSDPFAALTWPKAAVSPPDPFTPDERDRILEWFANRSPAYYPFVFTLFHTGMRPSEATGLRWGDVDLKRGTITIARSRYLGSEEATKTAKSHRTIRLLPDVCDVLRELQPVHADVDAYVFTNAKNGGPIDQSEWPKDHWRRALRAAAIRPRKFYTTRHTFISIALSRGVNLKYLAEYCGTSVAMIEHSYGRYLHTGDDPLKLLMETPKAGVRARAAAKPVTLSTGSPVFTEKPLWNKASPTGFEPVSPA